MSGQPKNLQPVVRGPGLHEDATDDDADVGAGEGPLSYEVVKTGSDLETYIEDIADTVRVGLDQSIAILTPWFFNNMPRIYYQTTPRQEKVRHLSAIITGHVFETKQTVELWDRDRSKVTFIGPGGDRKILLDMTAKLKVIAHLKMGAIYFSRDKLLYLSTFFCSRQKPLEPGNARIAEKVNAARKLMLAEFPDQKESIDHYLANLDNDFVVYATAARLHITYRMVSYMSSHEGARTFVESFDNSPSARLTLGIKNVNPSQVMESIVHLFHRYDYNITRAFVVKFETGYDEPITVMHFIIDHASGDHVDTDSVPMRKLNKAIRTLGWVDMDEYSNLARDPYNFSINAANLVRSMSTWCHIFLGKENPYIYSLYRIERAFFNYHKITEDLVDLFRLRFDPLKEQERQLGGADVISARIVKEIEETVVEEVDQNIFRQCLNFLSHVLKTNYFISSKTGLAFRISPDALDSRYYKNKPFGIFYIIGKDFRCFQVRWKDISRGGMRVVMPRNEGDYAYALAGLFDEVYGLSYAQQMKNKDIPEGGSKAVVVLRPGGYRDQAVKGAVNALMDLLVYEDEPHEGTAAEQIDYYKKEEIIYLGPDENMTNELINWITQHVARRGYPYARAFMSSKPGDGINHKEFGVTSEGVNVYVDNILRFIGINPRKDRFRISMTGGPDGDVAGNELRILNREYGENARLVSISDGMGAAHDPNGLDWPELLRLVTGAKSIAEFNPQKLSGDPKAFVIRADSNPNIRIRNELFAKTAADIFIPAGGRPYTMSEKNWQLFLRPDGVPNVRAIVEGANIFFTDEARRRLQDKGVMIIKDSSANKTGVICSSYEIIACLTISSKEFQEIKDVYVKQVIEILRSKADAEARLLLRYYRRGYEGKNLVDLSIDVSREINEITDCLLEELTKRQDEVLNSALFQGLIYRHCPPILVEKFKARILKRLPQAHQIAILSAYIASHIVYREGLGWMHSIPPDKRYETARRYMEMSEQANLMIDSVLGSNIDGREEIAAILGRSAAKYLTMAKLESVD